MHCHLRQYIKARLHTHGLFDELTMVKSISVHLSDFQCIWIRLRANGVGGDYSGRYDLSKDLFRAMRNSGQFRSNVTYPEFPATFKVKGEFLYKTFPKAF